MQMYSKRAKSRKISTVTSMCLKNFSEGLKKSYEVSQGSSGTRGIQRTSNHGHRTRRTKRTQWRVNPRQSNKKSVKKMSLHANVLRERKVKKISSVTSMCLKNFSKGLNKSYEVSQGSSGTRGIQRTSNHGHRTHRTKKTQWRGNPGQSKKSVKKMSLQADVLKESKVKKNQYCDFNVSQKIF